MNFADGWNYLFYSFNNIKYSRHLRDDWLNIEIYGYWICIKFRATVRDFKQIIDIIFNLFGMIEMLYSVLCDWDIYFHLFFLQSWNHDIPRVTDFTFNWRSSFVKRILCKLFNHFKRLVNTDAQESRQTSKCLNSNYNINFKSEADFLILK